MHWPCRFDLKSPSASEEQSRCCNVKSGHSPKGHQNSLGAVIGPGAYETDFDPTVFGSEWVEIIQANLTGLQNATFQLGRKLPGRTDAEIAALLHRQRVNDFYNSLGNVAEFVSHSACFSCLRELPECPLPCGHVLCLPCVQAYGRKPSRTKIELTRCPLHVQDIISDPPWVITTKPPHAGVRVLCLDGYVFHSQDLTELT